METIKTQSRFQKAGLSGLILVLLSGCAANTVEEVNKGLYKGELIRPPMEHKPEISTADTKTKEAELKQSEIKFESGPGILPTHTQALGQETELGKGLSTEPSISVSFNNLPLPAFINEVFSNQLGYSYVLAPGLEQQKDLVTLKINEPQSPAQLFRTARAILADYGLRVSDQEGVLRFQLSAESRADGTPVLISGLALPTVPISHRPVFQLVELKVMSNRDVMVWVKDAFKGLKIEVREDARRNAILLKGPIDEVTQAVEMVKVFDQPLMKGRHTLSIVPAYSKAEDIAANLVAILQSEGYAANLSPPYGSVIILPVKGSNQLIAFAPDRRTLNHIRRWAVKLDQKTPMDIAEGYFTYEVQNTQAENLVDILNQVHSGTASVSRSSKNQSSSVGGASSGSGKESKLTGGSSGAFVLDKNRNTIIFKGSGQEWLQLKPMIDSMDKPVPSVLIEVLLAEVTLTDKTEFGVEWSTYGLAGGSSKTTLDDGHNLASTAAGLTYAFTSGGATKATITALYKDDKVAIRSSPKLMVKSGEEATIEVGDEIPVVTGTNTSSEGGQVNETVQYRKTGVILTITPIVQASGLVDLQISQELSEVAEASPGSTSSAKSPTILNRKIETSVTLRDGGAVLLGGLISQKRTLGESGVPFFGQLPLIGNLFKSQADNGKKTELVMMVMPYVIRDNKDAQKITNSIKQGLELNDF